VRIAQGLEGVRAKVRSANWNDLERLPLPALANGGQGWFIGVAGEEAWSSVPAPPTKWRAPRWKIWDGELVLVTTRENVGLIARTFDFTWFIPQIIRYRHLIGEVLLITLALNLLGLAAPLFFQNVVDKVLVHWHHVDPDGAGDRLSACPPGKRCSGGYGPGSIRRPVRRSMSNWARSFPSPSATSTGVFRGTPRRRYGYARAPARNHP
jgi:hypothetical protein